MEKNIIKEHIYDVIIVGGGPAGYTAALYAVRAGLDTVVLEKLSAGGQMAMTTQIDNYPGFENGVDGFDLGEKMQLGAERFGAKTELVEVNSYGLSGEIKKVSTSEGEFLGKTVIIATGAKPRELEVPKEKELVGRGVNYCAACDGMAYKGKTVAVIGGGNSAVGDALILSRIAKKVIIVHRRDSLRATKVYNDILNNTSNIEFMWNSQVSELIAEDKLKAIKLKDTHTGEEVLLEVDGIFVSVGRKPETENLDSIVNLDKAGYIVAGEDTKTNVKGVFAAGDVRTKALRQIITAAADGAIAAHYAEEYLVEGK